ncbi:Glucosidase 2 subunit beta [Penicillium malachiteum]|uniref:Glucosidase 2 subunit beta n=1 Tax=Penicillium malachiteum TaxID=1324776 RepID=UPI002548D7E2|nr:Glucosidase 2 subunit beta [Penicillium malachiteum]KAJ5729320.1 Glucosidase 2 subunit beta [Penicillium malachiteum]
MRLPQSLILLAVAGTSARASIDKVARPRGVAPEFAKFYQDTESFTCISNPAVKIPVSAVNDDFCDCPDGSDEPGTAACSHLSQNSPLTVADRPGHSDIDLTLSLPGFYCKNKGHRPSFVPFQRVNDGICDYELCCDGSDEWAHAGGTKCEDRCKEIGKKWRKEEEQRQKAMTAALKKKKELVAEAGKQQKDIENNIARFSVEVKDAEAKVAGLETALKIVEEQERKVVRTKGKGKVNALAGVAKGRVQELRESIVELRQQRDETRQRMKELEEILSTFKVEYNPNFNDEGVKRAVRSWEDYAARELGDVINDAKERDLDEIVKVDGKDSGVDWEHWENEEDGFYKIAAYLPPSLVAFLEEQVLSVRSYLEDNGFLAKSSGDSVSESRAVTDARDALKSAQDSLKNLNNKLNDQQSDLEKDYGTAGIFRALRGQCIDKDAGEYKYEHCFLDSTKQIQKKGGSVTSMGKFTQITTTRVEELSETGEIITIEKVALEYERGQSCWNGPSRSTKVILQCGEQNEILKVAEDEKCVYSMHVTTPAVCSGGQQGASSSKDEL